VICKYNVDNHCLHYDRAAPPPQVCDKCKFMQPVEATSGTECDLHTYDKKWCLDRSNPEIFNWVSRRSCNPEKCKLLVKE